MVEMLFLWIFITLFNIIMTSWDCSVTDAEFTLQEFSPNFTRRQVLRNRRQIPEIRGKSVLVHVSDNHAGRFSNGRLHPPEVAFVGCIRHKEDLILEY